MPQNCWGSRYGTQRGSVTETRNDDQAGIAVWVDTDGSHVLQGQRLRIPSQYGNHLMTASLTHLQRIPLWPDAPPGSVGISLTETIEERSPDTAQFRDRAVTAIGSPSITAWLPEKPNGSSIVLAPGGGYVRVVLDKEGHEIAQWLNSLGITVFILLYRLPGEGHAARETVPLQDAQRALRLVRANAAAWGLTPDRIGAMGCSAGGHVIGSLATMFDRKVYTAIDSADAQSARPDLVSLLYPVLTMDERWAHPGSRLNLLGDTPDDATVAAWSCEQQVSQATPPCFITHPGDDASVPVENSLMLYRALREKRLDAALHVFEAGGHGHGIRLAQGKPVSIWTDVFTHWLRGHKYL
ncbi:MAG: alpha/beta hydrolase [Candidatus Dactylopiibacterium carminicum]|nr:MAG: alpha/beta hydrolase [Candidatus Dactylopiibacterium carminicum]